MNEIIYFERYVDVSLAGGRGSLNYLIIDSGLKHTDCSTVGL